MLVVSMNNFRVFIGWDSRFPEPAEVLAYSIKKRSSIDVDIHYLKLSELELNREHDPLASTEFTYSRFLVPYLCNYEGTALFLDNDMICLSDIKELSDLSMEEYALRVVQQDHNPETMVKMYGAIQTSYPRKNWSSVMLMNCSKLKLWTKELVETQTGKYLHRFQGIPDEEIGKIPLEWNHLDFMTEKTKLIHYTEGGPWFKEYENHPHADVWYKEKEEMLCQRK